MKTAIIREENFHVLFLHNGSKQGNDYQILNRKPLSRNTTHRQSFNLIQIKFWILFKWKIVLTSFLQLLLCYKTFTMRNIGTVVFQIYFYYFGDWELFQDFICA